MARNKQKRQRMTLKRAGEIVLELARDNMIEKGKIVFTDGFDMGKDQREACDLIEKFLKISD